MLYILVLIAVFPVFFAILWILLKKPLKAFFLASLISLIIVIIFGFIVYKDAIEFADKFPNEPKLFLFEENNEIVGGAVFTEFEIEIREGEEPDIDFVTEEQLTELNNAYKDENFESMLGNNYMLFIFKGEIFEGVEIEETPEGFEGGEIPPEAFEVGEGPPTTPEEIELYQTQYNTMVYFMKFSKLMEQKGPLTIIIGYKSGNIIIYPETITFKFLKEVPESLFDKISEKMVQR